MDRVDNKINETNECTSISCHFDGHVDVWVQCCSYPPIQRVQGYLGSHWKLPMGNYLLCITPAAARATENKTTTKNGPTLLAILMAVAVHQYNTACITQ